MFDKKYDIAFGGWIGDYLDPLTFLDMWVKDGGNNRTGWSNDEYEKLIAQAGRPAMRQRDSSFSSRLRRSCSKSARSCRSTGPCATT